MAPIIPFTFDRTFWRYDQSGWRWDGDRIYLPDITGVLGAAVLVAGLLAQPARPAGVFDAPAGISGVLTQP